MPNLSWPVVVSLLILTVMIVVLALTGHASLITIATTAIGTVMVTLTHGVAHQMTVKRLTPPASEEIVVTESEPDTKKSG